MITYEKKLFNKDRAIIVSQAGGTGSGLWDYTQHKTSKLMIYLGDLPVIHVSIIPSLKAGFKRYIISVREHAEQIIDYFGDGKILGPEIRVDYVREPEEEPLGRLGCIEEARKKKLISPSDHVITQNACDILVCDFNEIIKYHCDGLEKNYTVTNVVADSFIVPGGLVEEDVNGRTGKRIVERPLLPTPQGRFLNTGIYILHPSAVDVLIENIDRYPINIEESKGLEILYEERKVQNFHVSGENFYQHKRFSDIKRSRKINWREKLDYWL